MSAYHEEYWAKIRAETDERDRRLAERAQEQERLHAIDPIRHPKYIPVDDEEFPDETYTAGWVQEQDA